MPRRGRLFLYPQKNMTIQISRQAEYLLGTHNVKGFVARLVELLEALGANHAHVKKHKNEIIIEVRREDGWGGVMHFRRPIMAWEKRAQQ